MNRVVGVAAVSDCWLVGSPAGWIVIAALLAVVWLAAGPESAYADNLVMTLTFDAAGPAEDEARHDLSAILDGVVNAYPQLGATAGEMTVANQTGWYRVSGNVTLHGSPAQLLEVERQYELADVLVVGDGYLGDVRAESVCCFGERAATLGLVAAIAGATAVGLTIFFVFVGVWAGAIGFGGIFGMASAGGVLGYLEYVRFAI